MVVGDDTQVGVKWDEDGHDMWCCYGESDMFI